MRSYSRYRIAGAVSAAAINAISADLDQRVDQVEIKLAQQHLAQLAARVNDLANIILDGDLITWQQLTPEYPDFGAVGDGVTDDTAAIQSWFDAIHADDNQAVLQYATAGNQKQYLIRGTLYFPNAIIDWRGSWLILDCESSGDDQWAPTGYALPVHKGAGTHKYDGACLLPRCVPMSGGDPYPDDTSAHFEWYNLNILLDRTTNDNTPSYPVRFFTVTNALLSNCWIYTNPGTGAINQNAWDVYWHCKNMTFLNCGMDLQPDGADGGSGGFWIRNFDTTAGHDTSNITILGGYYKSGSNDECIAAWVPQQNDAPYGEVKYTKFIGCHLHSTYSGRGLTIMNHYPEDRPDSAFATHTVTGVTMQADYLAADAAVFKIRDMQVNASDINIYIQAVAGGTTADRAVLIQLPAEPDGRTIDFHGTNIQVYCTADIGLDNKVRAFEGIGETGTGKHKGSLLNCGCQTTSGNYFQFGLLSISAASGGRYDGCSIGASNVGKLRDLSITGNVRNCFDMDGIEQIMDQEASNQVPLYLENIAYLKDLLSIRNLTVRIRSGTVLRPFMFNTTVGAEGYKYPTSGLAIPTILENIIFRVAYGVTVDAETWTAQLCQVQTARNIVMAYEDEAGEITTWNVLDHSYEFDPNPDASSARRRPYLGKTATYVGLVTDIGKNLNFYGAGPYTYTLPPLDGTASIGACVWVTNLTAAALSILVASGDTLLVPAGQAAALNSRGRMVCQYTSENTWTMTGDLASYVGIAMTAITKNADYVGVLADCGRRLEFYGTGPHTYTLPPYAEMASNFGFQLEIINRNTSGNVVIAAASGDTVHTPPGYDAELPVYGYCRAIYLYARHWLITGDLEASA